MKSVIKILKKIDGIEFQANIAVANGLNHLITIIDHDIMLVELVEAAKNDTKSAAKILSNAYKKLEEPFDTNYIHPHDLTLAISIYILDKARCKGNKRLMSKMASIGNFHWSYLMIGKIYK